RSTVTPLHRLPGRAQAAPLEILLDHDRHPSRPHHLVPPVRASLPTTIGGRPTPRQQPEPGHTHAPHDPAAAHSCAAAPPATQDAPALTSGPDTAPPFPVSTRVRCGPPDARTRCR